MVAGGGGGGGAPGRVRVHGKCAAGGWEPAAGARGGAGVRGGRSGPVAAASQLQPKKRRRESRRGEGTGDRRRWRCFRHRREDEGRQSVLQVLRPCCLVRVLMILIGFPWLRARAMAWRAAASGAMANAGFTPVPSDMSEDKDQMAMEMEQEAAVGPGGYDSLHGEARSVFPLMPQRFFQVSFVYFWCCLRCEEFAFLSFFFASFFLSFFFFFFFFVWVSFELC